MNWLAGLQQHRRLCVGGFLLISLSAFAVSLQRNPISFDAFWHLKTGEDWLKNGLSPWVDHYSFTFNGESISNPPVVFQALLHYAVSALGILKGFLLVKALAQLLTLLAVYLFLKMVKARALLIAIVIPSVVVLLQMRSFVRPELFSYTFSVLAMLLYFRAKDRVSASSMVPMILLMLAWTNYHSSIVGYVIFAGFFVDCAVRQFRDRDKAAAWFSWMAWGLVLLLAGFLNHDMIHPVIEALTFPEEWKSHIIEYFAPLPYIKKSPGLMILLLVALVTPLLAIRQGRFGLLLIWAVLVYTAANVQRMIAPAGIVTVVMMAGLLAAKGFPDKSLASGRRGFMLSGVLWYSVAAAALYANVALSLEMLKINRSLLTRFPEALTRYMLEEQIRGVVFNDYGIGGYLIYRLAPHNRVYIDGRTQILYPVNHLQKFESIQRSPALLVEEARKYDIDLIIVPFQQAKHDLVIDTGAFVLDFVDAGYSLYRRYDGRFPLHGQLLSRPACWHEDMAEEFAAENEQINNSMPFYSGLVRYSNFVSGYIQAADKQAYFDASFVASKWSDFDRRFVAFRVFESGNFDLARILLGNVETLRIEDYLASSMAMLNGGNQELALQILRSSAGADWISASPWQMAMFLQLWTALDEYPGLTVEDTRLKDRILENMAESGSAAAGIVYEMNPAAFCKIASEYTTNLKARSYQ